MSDPPERDEATAELVGFCTARPLGADRYRAEGPDWFGERVFGGVVAAHALSAAIGSVDADRAPHSLHGYFLRPQRPGSPVDLEVDRVRDGRTFSTRRVTMRQEGKELFAATCSFHGGDAGDDYQIAMPSDVPGPDGIESSEHAPPPFDVRDVGPTPISSDGTYRSTRRSWVRAGAMSEDPHDHLVVATFLSDMTGSSFRPLTMDDWGHTTDASIDHAVWFHAPIRVDEWLYCDFQALVNGGGRATVRGCFFSRDGRLCMSMAQELLIRPVG